MMADTLWVELSSAGRLGPHRVHFLPHTESTNSVALGLLKNSGVEAGTLVVAESQSAGRGRLGRFWASPAGAGLYFSCVVRPALLPVDFPKITLAAGLAVCLAVEKEVGIALGLKWPNDLYLNGKKCGGILTETEALAGQASPAAVIGIGVNINTDQNAFPAELSNKATSLFAETGRIFARGPLLAVIVAELEEVLGRLEQGGFAQILRQWRQRDIHAGKTVSWLGSQGTIVTGLSLGPDEDGILHIRDQAGNTHTVISGDVSLTNR
ncbi:biotin--[acetyl-CoA-carboxylase] ligase [Thiovibrio sp. JS02]